MAVMGSDCGTGVIRAWWPGGQQEGGSGGGGGDVGMYGMEVGLITVPSAFALRRIRQPYLPVYSIRRG